MLALEEKMFELEIQPSILQCPGLDPQHEKHFKQ